MLTHRGRGVTVAGVVLYAVGVALGYVELVVLGVGALLAVAVGFGWMVRRPAVDIRRSIEPDRVARGTPAHGTITFTNPGRLPSSAVTAVERWGDERFPIEAPRLAAGASASTRYELPTGRRAAIDVGPIDLTREDPLGLWRTVRTAGDVRRLWVHPVALPLVALPPGRQRDLEGVGGDHVPQGSTTFHTLREYVIGDDFRRIHWRSYARTGELMVREDVDASQPRITLLVDDRAGSYGGAFGASGVSDDVDDFDDFEEALDVAASVVVAATGAGVPLRMVTVGGRAVEGGRHTYLDVLAELVPVPSGDLHPAAASLATDRRSDTLVAVTGLPDAGDLAALGALARRYDDAVLALVGERAAHEPIPAGIDASVLRGATAVDVVARWNRSLG